MERKEAVAESSLFLLLLSTTCAKYQKNEPSGSNQNGRIAICDGGENRQRTDHCHRVKQGDLRQYEPKRGIGSRNNEQHREDQQEIGHNRQRGVAVNRNVGGKPQEGSNGDQQPDACKVIIARSAGQRARPKNTQLEHIGGKQGADPVEPNEWVHIEIERNRCADPTYLT